MTNAEKQLKEMEEQMRREQASQKKEKQGRSAKPYAVKKESHPLASFLIGLVLLGAGIYWVLNSFVVSFSWGSLWGGFGMNTSLATGLMLVPLLIGIGLLFFLDRKWIGWVIQMCFCLCIYQINFSNAHQYDITKLVFDIAESEFRVTHPYIGC